VQQQPINWVHPCDGPGMRRRQAHPMRWNSWMRNWMPSAMRNDPLQEARRQEAAFNNITALLGLHSSSLLCAAVLAFAPCCAMRKVLGAGSLAMSCGVALHNLWRAWLMQRLITTQWPHLQLPL